MSYINPLMGTLKPQMVIGTLVVDGWVVTFGTTMRGLGPQPRPPRPLLAVPNVTAHCPPINGQCTNFILFDVAPQLPMQDTALRAVIFMTIFSSFCTVRHDVYAACFFVTVTCPCSSTTKCHVNLFVYNNNNNNNAL